MFFRRMFSRKDKDKERDRDSSASPPPPSTKLSNTPTSSASILDSSNQCISIVQKSPMKRRMSASGVNFSVIQLTPLWEHIIRTRTLPEDLNPATMFDEFIERLGDPEWQVRQHALRVLIDVLIVMGQKADSYFAPIIPQLVENLGHPAPTVRKGALDALRVYISETAMPESILLEIMDIGLNQRITNEPFGGRLTCGVMLSLPSLVQATLHTSKRNYILQSAVDMLVNKMTQVTYQEVTLKVLLRIRDLVGPDEFSNYMSHGAYREFELLCNVYGLSEPETLVSSSRSSWHAINSFEPDDGDSSSNQVDMFWRSEDDDELFKGEEYDPNEKVIMETEIKINDDTLTMRILERKDEPLEDGNCHAIICSDDDEITGTLENSGLIHVLSDSELEDINNNVTDDNENDDRFVPRTPKRVTFGGEIVKMRTPDSDTTVHSDADNSSRSMSERRFENLNFLTVEIPNDNTKPVQRSKSATVTPPSSVTPTPRSTPPASPKAPLQQPPLKDPPTKVIPAPAADPTSPSKPISSSPTSLLSPKKQLTPDESKPKSATASPFRRISISPVDAIISPKPVHKEIEVLHNLQRSPCISPRPVSRPSSRNNVDEKEEESESAKVKKEETVVPAPSVKSWEELKIVDDDVLKDLKSGDWRHRLQAITVIEEALKSSETLAKIQPCLDSFMRMLLSSERNPEVAEDKRRILINLISRLPLENLENRSTQIITGLCRQGGAGSNRVCKSLMQRLPPSFIVLKLLSDDFLHARSSRFRENALQMVMYALMTFPSTCFDTGTCINRTIYAALDRKRRVRQASLDVLAVLGQVTSPRVVLDSVQTIAGGREDGKDLSVAVKARLARKQLPIIGPDGSIQYALRVPSPHSGDPLSEINLGADVEWIISGIGTAERRLKAPHEILALGVGARPVDDFISTSSSSSSFQGNSDDTDDSRTSFQYSLATASSLHYKTSNGSAIGAGDIFGIHGKRIASRSHSDSQSDGRNSNSDGSGSTQIIKLPVTSRFPTMDVGSIYVNRQAYRNPYEQFNLSTHRISSTYTKGQQTRKSLKGNYPQSAFNESKFDDASPRPASQPAPFESVGGTTSILGQRRFTNVEKFIMQSNKPQQQSSCQIEQAASPEKGTNGIIQNSQQPPTHDSEDRIFSKSAIILDRAISSKSRHDLEETESFKQIDSINPTPEKLTISSGTTPAKVLDDENQGSVVLPNSVQTETKTPTPSTKSVTTESIHSRPESTPPSSETLQVRSESVQSHAESIPSRSESVISRPITAQSKPSEEVEARPQSVVSTITTKSEKQGESNEDVLVVDEVDEVDEVEAADDKTSATKVEEDITESKVASVSEENLTNIQLDTSAPGSEVNISNEIEHHENAKTPVEQLPEAADALEVVVETEVISDPPLEEMPRETTELLKKDLEELKTDELKVLDPTPKHESPDPPIATPTTPVIQDIFESPLPIRSVSIPSLDQEYPNSEKYPPQSASKGTPAQNVSTESIPPRHSSIAKSNDSIFGSTRKLDPDSKSTASTTSSEYPPSHTTSLDEPIRAKSHGNVIKASHLPLIRKAKTTLFGRSRRVSPIKQTLKLTQTEVFPQTLMKFDKPKDALAQALIHLDSTEWETVIVGLRSLVRMMRHHPEVLDTQMHIVCIQLGKAVRNLRSQVSRAACQASTELFTVRTKFLEQECDDLAGNLLHRTADTNRFLRADAMRALESMCDNLSPAKIIHLLSTKGATHQNATVRTATAKLSNRLVDRIGHDRVFTLNREHRDKLLTMGANLLQEGSLETRSYTKTLFRSLAEHAQCGRILKEVVPIRTYRNIEKTLKSIM
ncbi:uncharacterized protein LOC119646189 isoform X2 [Hermetia illucens]|uniref:uncharacterized protein LOC119646189 isoform X2 n=1 Tax=Hermetia illucens TaxID=343691 RepID=UPI0018CBF7C7|nr:uncharacterized protein LOC119646189 isoform X2 [Hermetia illucens]